VSGIKEAQTVLAQADAAFDLILSDMVLPDGSGMDLVEWLQSRSSRVPLLLCSGYTGRRSGWEAAQTAGIPYLEKPYSIIELLGAVDRALSGGGQYVRG